jgi:anti-anti-sigma factor
VFNITEESQSIRVELASELRHVDRVILEAQHFLGSCGFGEGSLEFNIVLRELLINAIEHGNLDIPEKEVLVLIEALGAGLFSIEVNDEGQGFDHRRLKLTIPDNPRQVRRRGLPLVHEFCEEIKFNERGNSVKVLIRINRETEFELLEQDGWQIIRPSGNVTAVVAAKLSSLLMELVAKKHTRFRFDFLRVLDLDSISLSVFIVLARTIAEEGGQAQLEIVNISRELAELFQMTRMDARYRLVPAWPSRIFTRRNSKGPSFAAS